MTCLKNKEGIFYSSNQETCYLLHMLYFLFVFIYSRMPVQSISSSVQENYFPHLQMILLLIFCTFLLLVVLSCGTKGVPQSGIGNRLNVGKLESRMLCRRMETQGVVKVRAVKLMQTWSLTPNSLLSTQSTFCFSNTWKFNQTFCLVCVCAVRDE